MTKVSPRTIGTVFGAIFLALICALAYNMGGSSESVRNTERLASLTSRFERESERKKQCQSVVDGIRNKQNAEDVSTELDETLEKTESLTIQATQDIAKSQTEMLQCESDLSAKRKELEDGPRGDLDKRIILARNTLTAAQKTLLDANATRTKGDKDLLRLIFSYIQANTAMSKRLKRSQETATR